MNTPLISVCMPAFNAAPYIGEAIESVLCQTYPNWELIIIDDGSKDETMAVASKFLDDARVKIFSQENRGQCNASNVAFKKSSGSFIKFLDADDIIDKFFLERMVEKATDEDCMYFSHCVNFRGSLECLKPYRIEEWDAMNPVDFLVNDASTMRQGGRWLIPRRIIEKGGLWNENLSLINDFEYFTRLSLASKAIVYVNDAVLYYRQVYNSLSSQRSLQACMSAYHSILWAGEQLLKVEDSKRVRLHLANAFQDVLFRIYPQHPELVKKLDKEISRLGGASIFLNGGKLTVLSNRIIGWKNTVLIKRWIKRISASAQKTGQH